jgi:N-acetylmuramoyl-L-alanine amidase
LYTHKQAESLGLAEHLAETVADLAETQNRGQKDARFYVLRNTLIPAILVEVGFLSHAKEEKLLETSHYRQRLAESLAKGILEYGN